MAKIKFGMMMTDARGKLGGQVFSKNRSGSYVRTKVTPSNPQTFDQQISRSILGNISSEWSGLTDSQRAGWNSAVSDWAKTDIFGDLKNPTGKNLFTSLNKNLLQSGQSTIDVVPDRESIPFLGFVQATVEIGVGIELSGVVSIPVGFVGQLSATPPLSQGTNFYKGKYRVIQYIPAGLTVTAKLQRYNDYVAKFGAPIAGSNISFQLKLIATNGQAGVPETAPALVSI